MRLRSSVFQRLFPVALPVALVFAGCGDDSATSPDATLPDATALDTHVGDDAADPDDAEDAQDVADPDVAADVADAAPERCEGVTCEGFAYCEADSCVPYPACDVEGACVGADDVCRAGFCVPGDVDIDGDGVVARDDCDETSADVYPGADEVCNGVDDDCDGDTDEGDATALCAASGTGDVCVDGACACGEGTFDADPEALGCECSATPAVDQGLTCSAPIDLGDLTDTGTSQVIGGTLMPEQEVWYRFRGVDTPDTTCDNYHVRVVFISDPESAYEFTVCRGDCGADCPYDRLIDYNWATDFRAFIDGRLTGQCPCTAPGAPPRRDISVCTDDTAEYFVRVKRRPDKPVLCSEYSIEVSNGVYDTP